MLSQLRVIGDGGSALRRRLLAAATVIALIAVACGIGGDERGAGSRQRESPALTSAPRAATLQKLELRADLSEDPVRWRLVASIPFGPRREELGYFFNRNRGSLPLLPRSFAVA
ncbi:MAG TPA: hypothetical protein VHI97_00540, partial [Actinomycetota bacterium]|nr:hypothetical protein [Actinomycetota bacterium]